jgi:hypothetical protein
MTEENRGNSAPLLFARAFEVLTATASLITLISYIVSKPLTKMAAIISVVLLCITALVEFLIFLYKKSRKTADAPAQASSALVRSVPPFSLAPDDRRYFNELSPVERREYCERVDALFRRSQAFKLLLQVCAEPKTGALVQSTFDSNLKPVRNFCLHDAERPNDVTEAPALLQTSGGEGEGIANAWRESQFMQEDATFAKSNDKLFVPTGDGQRFARLARFANGLSPEARKLLIEISKAPLTFGYSVSLVKYDGGREVVVPPPVRGYTDEENRERECALRLLLDAQLFDNVGVEKWSLLPLGRVLARIIESESSV